MSEIQKLAQKHSNSYKTGMSCPSIGWARNLTGGLSLPSEEQRDPVCPQLSQPQQRDSHLVFCPPLSQKPSTDAQASTPKVLPCWAPTPLGHTDEPAPRHARLKPPQTPGKPAAALQVTGAARPRPRPLPHRRLGKQAAQPGLELPHGAGGLGAQAQVRVPPRGAPHQQRRRFLHGRSPPRARAPRGAAFYLLAASRPAPCASRDAVAATDWPRKESVSLDGLSEATSGYRVTGAGLTRVRRQEVAGRERGVLCGVSRAGAAPCRS